MMSVTKLMKTLSEIVFYAYMNSIKTNITSHKCQFAAPFVIFCCLDAQCRI